MTLFRDPEILANRVHMEHMFRYQHEMVKLWKGHHRKQKEKITDLAINKFKIICYIRSFCPRIDVRLKMASDSWVKLIKKVFGKNGIHSLLFGRSSFG